MNYTKIDLDKNNRMLRAGLGKNDGIWFVRLDLWFWGFRLSGDQPKVPEFVPPKVMTAPKTAPEKDLGTSRWSASPSPAPAQSSSSDASGMIDGMMMGMLAQNLMNNSHAPSHSSHTEPEETRRSYTPPAPAYEPAGETWGSNLGGSDSMSSDTSSYSSPSWD